MKGLWSSLNPIAKAYLNTITKISAFVGLIIKIKNAYSGYKYYFGVVKADCYGHGDLECINAIIGGGCNYLAVSSLDEAIEHIRKYSSGHSESIITNNKENAEIFLNKEKICEVELIASESIEKLYIPTFFDNFKMMS